MANLTPEEIQAMTIEEVKEVQEHIEIDENPESVILNLLILGVTAAALLLRLVRKSTSGTGLGWDDFLMTAAWLRFASRSREHIPLKFLDCYSLRQKITKSYSMLALGSAMALMQCMVATVFSRRF